MASDGALPRPAPSMPAVPIQGCPIAATLGALGKKWTLTILREVAFYPGCGFSAILNANQGLRQRTLSIRLRQLAVEGLVRKVPDPTGGRHARYELTDRGLQVWPILAALFQYGARNFPQQVFEDGQPRDLDEVYPKDAALMLGRLADIARAPPAPTLPSLPRSARGPPGPRAASRTGPSRRPVVSRSRVGA